MILDVAGAPVYAYTGSRASTFLDAAVPASRRAPLIVFVHGAALDHSVWALQSRYFAHHGFDVLALDLPGHGRSGGDALPSVAAIAHWLVSVLDAVGAPDAALVGHSLGALAALEGAARHPERVRQLALLGPAVPMEVSDELMEAARTDEALAFELINGWSFSPAKQFGGNTMPGVWLTGSALQLMHRTPAGVLAVDLGACRDYDAGLAAAAAVRAPTLVVTGARDLMAPLRNAKALVEMLPNVRTVALPDCGHSMMAEQPDAVLDLLREFLNS